MIHLRGLRWGITVKPWVIRQGDPGYSNEFGADQSQALGLERPDEQCPSTGGAPSNYAPPFVS